MDVVSVGARAPLGLSSRQVAMCLRARKLEPRTIRLDDRRGRHIGICATGGLAETLVGYSRFVRLAAPALAEAARALAPGSAPPALVMVAPEPGRADDDPRIVETLVDDLSLASGVVIDPARRGVVRSGQAGFAAALDAARAWLEDGAERVLVGGVDSYYHPEVLRALDAGYRLHALDAEDGFIPSEGAGFLMLANKSAAALGSLPLWLRGEETEAAADVMTDMVISAGEQLGPAAWVIHDVNGESHRVDEWDLVALRTLPDAVQSRWARELGDVGAASGPLFSAVALRLCEAHGAPAHTALLALHSEGSERALVALRGADHG